MKKLKMTVEDLSRQNGDLNGLKARLTQENFELQVRNQDHIFVLSDRTCNQWESGNKDCVIKLEKVERFH